MDEIEINTEQQPKPLSVFDFIEQVNASLLSHHGRVQGEVTSINKNYPTVIYFTIKDKESKAQLECIIWHSTYNQNGVDLDVGDEIIVTGTPEVYAPKGRFSLKVQTIEYAGEGALKKAYEELKKKLLIEGLFATERKRELPEYPQKIGVITSKAGVVLQDFSSNLSRYGFRIIVVDSRVEGKDAIHEILASIKTLEKQDIEVLVIMRGGGSWESLQPFNTESVVRAIANFKCPVLTGIGHDADVTLAELVADIGKSTPTAVAEALNDSWDTLVNSIESSEIKVITAFQQLLDNISSSIEFKSSNICNTYQRILFTSTQTLSNRSTKIYSLFTELERKISKASTALQGVIGSMKSSIRIKKKYLDKVPIRVIRFSRTYTSSANETLTEILTQIYSGQHDYIQDTRKNLKIIERSIKLADPGYNLRLGYSLSYVKGKLIRSVKDVVVGEMAEIHLSDGKFTSKIKSIK